MTLYQERRCLQLISLTFKITSSLYKKYRYKAILNLIKATNRLLNRVIERKLINKDKLRGLMKILKKSCRKGHIKIIKKFIAKNIMNMTMRVISVTLQRMMMSVNKVIMYRRNYNRLKSHLVQGEIMRRMTMIAVIWKLSIQIQSKKKEGQIKLQEKKMQKNLNSYKQKKKQRN